MSIGLSTAKFDAGRHRADGPPRALLEAVFALLVRDGCARFSLSAVASETGMRVEEIRAHFGDDHAAMRCIIDDKADGMLDPSALHGRSFSENLHGLLKIGAGDAPLNQWLVLAARLVSASGKQPWLGDLLRERSLLAARVSVDAWLEQQIERGHLSAAAAVVPGAAIVQLAVRATVLRVVSLSLTGSIDCASDDIVRQVALLSPLQPGSDALRQAISSWN